MKIFRKLAKVLTGAGAPILATLVGGPSAGVNVAMDILASTMGVEPKPEAVMTAIAADPEAFVKLRQAELANATRLAELRAEIGIAEIRESAENYRTDIKSEDLFTKRMRPTFGYCIGASWIMVFGPLGYRIWNSPAQEIAVMVAAVATLLPIFAAGLTVIGVYITKRTDEKAVAAGHEPRPGILSAVAARVMGPKT